MLMIAGQSLAVSADQETKWPSLVAEALRAVEDGERQVPTVWFRTDTGVSGSLPISDVFPVSFVDDETPSNFLGSVASLGRAAEPPDVFIAR
ncbi:hypothetical protein [Frigoribacterium sp. Leaf44]|uniref:hypothetical protein n=1 Tax=Frigoribacterium sp. Leaf44 TaxID=1736220 RepID=UPI0010F7E373|nr:hypothetical protein [Frigoribacterium sp. Leaf44]